MDRKHNPQQVPVSATLASVQDNEALLVQTQVPTNFPARAAFFQCCAPTLFDLLMLTVSIDPMALAALGVFAVRLFGETFFLPTTHQMFKRTISIAAVIPNMKEITICPIYQIANWSCFDRGIGGYVGGAAS